MTPKNQIHRAFEFFWIEGKLVQQPDQTPRRSIWVAFAIALDQCRVRERYPARRPFYINTRKGNRLPHEAGLKLLNEPRAPKELPVSALLRNAHGIAEWKLFLNE